MIGPMDVIYADELFALNALIDYALLCMGARLASLPRRRGRFALAAALGGVYAVGAAALPWLNAGAVKLAASLLLALAAFGGSRSLWRGWGAFLAVSALFAGALCAGVLLSRESGAAPGAPSLRQLVLSFGVCWAAVRFALGRVERARRRPCAEVTLRLAGREARLRALRDTGSTLTDPLSGAGVLVADRDALAPALGVPLPPDTADAASVFRALAADPALSARLRLIPYAGLGRSGLLVGFRPDELLLDGAPSAYLTAVSPTPINGGDYNAII